MDHVRREVAKLQNGIPLEPRYWKDRMAVHFGRLIKEFQESVRREPLIPAGSPLDFVPRPQE